MFYLIWAWFRLNLKLNHIKHLNNCYQLATREWYSKLLYTWRITSTSKTKLSENYILCSYIILTATAAMLNTLVKPNNIIECWEHICVSPLTGKCVKNNSQTSVVHGHMLFCKTVVCPKYFQFMLKVHAISNLRFKKKSPQYRYICFDIESVAMHFLENRRSNLINFWFISLIRSIEMLCI